MERLPQGNPNDNKEHEAYGMLLRSRPLLMAYLNVFNESQRDRFVTLAWAHMKLSDEIGQSIGDLFWEENTVAPLTSFLRHQGIGLSPLEPEELQFAVSNLICIGYEWGGQPISPIERKTHPLTRVLPDIVKQLENDKVIFSTRRGAKVIENTVVGLVNMGIEYKAKQEEKTTLASLGQYAAGVEPFLIHPPASVEDTPPVDPPIPPKRRRRRRQRIPKDFEDAFQDGIPGIEEI